MRQSYGRPPLPPTGRPGVVGLARSRVTSIGVLRAVSVPGSPSGARQPSDNSEGTRDTARACEHRRARASACQAAQTTTGGSVWRVLEAFGTTGSGQRSFFMRFAERIAWCESRQFPIPHSGDKNCQSEATICVTPIVLILLCLT